jgi:hypothetical protein
VNMSSPPPNDEHTEKNIVQNKIPSESNELLLFHVTFIVLLHDCKDRQGH